MKVDNSQQSVQVRVRGGYTLLAGAQRFTEADGIVTVEKQYVDSQDWKVEFPKPPSKSPVKEKAGDKTEKDEDTTEKTEGKSITDLNNRAMDGPEHEKTGSETPAEKKKRERLEL